MKKLQRKLKKLLPPLKAWALSAKDNKLALLNLALIAALLIRQEIVIAQVQELRGVIVIIALRLSEAFTTVSDQFSGAINSILSLFGGSQI